MKRRIALLIVVGVLQTNPQIKADEIDVESNCSESFIGISLSLQSKAIIDEWMNKLTDLTNQNNALNEYNRDLSDRLKAHKLFHQYAKRLVRQQNNKIRRLHALLKERNQLIEYQRHAIQKLSEQVIKNPSFP